MANVVINPPLKPKRVWQLWFTFQGKKVGQPATYTDQHQLLEGVDLILLVLGEDGGILIEPKFEEAKNAGGSGS